MAVLYLALLVVLTVSGSDALVTKNCTLPWLYPVHNGMTTICPGTTCTWVWGDANGHCVTGLGSTVEGLFNSLAQVGMGYKYSKKFTIPGKYPYNCCVHFTQMDGSITVLAATDPQCKATGTVAAPTTKGCTCYGRCYGKDTCGKAQCPYPKKPLNTQKACGACCTGLKPVSLMAKCYLLCRSQK